MSVGKDQRRWTPEEETMLIELKDKGMKAMYIARQLNRTETCVYSKLSEIQHSQKRIDWTLEEVKIAVRMWDEGYSYSRIAKRIGKSRDAVSQKFYFMRKAGKL